MKNRLKKISNTFFIVGLILVLGGITYAFFNYTAFSNELITNNGEVYLKVAKDSNDLTLNNVFPETYTHAVWGSNHTLREDNIIEFTVIGKNTYEEAVYYEIDLEYGSDVSDKTRIDDKYLKFELTDITDPDHVLYLLKDISYESIDDTRIYVDTIKNTDSTKTRTYRLRVWYDEDIIISDTDSSADFRASDNSYQTNNSDLDIYTEVYSSVKVKVYGDFIEKTNPFAYLKYQTIDTAIDSSYFMCDMNNFVDYSSYILENYTTLTTVYPTDDYWIEDPNNEGVYIENPNGFHTFAPAVVNIGFYKLTSDEIQDYLDDYNNNKTTVKYLRDVTDYDKNGQKVYMIIVEADDDYYTENNESYFVYNYEEEDYDEIECETLYTIMFISEAIIALPENSSNLFDYYFATVNPNTLEELEEDIDDYFDSNYTSGYTIELESDSSEPEAIKSDLEKYKPSYLTNSTLNSYTESDGTYTFTYTNNDLRQLFKMFAHVESFDREEYKELWYFDKILSLDDDSTLYTEMYNLYDTLYDENPIEYMFYSLIEIDLDNVYSGFVENMDFMFMYVGNDCDVTQEEGASILNINKLNTRNVETMNGMFCGTILSELDLSNFDTRNVEVIDWMFSYMYLIDDEILGLNEFNVKSLKSIVGLFLESYIDNIILNKWNTKNILCMDVVLMNSTNYNPHSDLFLSIGVFNSGTEISTFYCNADKIDLSNWIFNFNYVRVSSNSEDIEKLSLIDSFSSSSGGGSCYNYNGNVSYLSINYVPDDYSDNTIKSKYCDYIKASLIFEGILNNNIIAPLHIVNNIIFNNIDMSTYTCYKTQLTTQAHGDSDDEVNIEVKNSNIKDFTILFGNFSHDPVLYNLDLSNTKFSGSLIICIELNINELNVDNIDTSDVTNMSSLFYGSSFEDSELDMSNFDMSNVLDLSGAFYDVSGLTSIDLSNCKIKKVNYINGLFSNSSLEEINLSNADFSNYTRRSDYSYDTIFPSYCEKIYLNNVKMTIVNNQYLYSVNAKEVYANNYSGSIKFDSIVEKIEMQNYDITGLQINYLFQNSTNLQTINVSFINSSHLTSFANLLSGCSNLENLTLSFDDTSNVTDMSYMFNYCSKLETIDMSTFSNSSLDNVDRMFNNCTSLVTIYVSEKWDNSKTYSSSDYLFTNDTNLLGGEGTTYISVNYSSYFKVDGYNGNPGYLTLKSN